MKIGILALQGDFDAHRKALGAYPSCFVSLVRSPEELDDLHGLILPGGESTTIGKLMVRHGLLERIQSRAAYGMAIYGTCAGLILLASEIVDSEQTRLGLMDITVARNAFGRQLDSFEANVDFPTIGTDPVRAVFIRAPYVTQFGEGVEELARFEDRVVAVRQGKILGTAFHPELTDDHRVHGLFVDMCSQ
ncbi:MAG: pyridoxal 5'-phosphate synthase glutaminase subunit PdxT [Chthonomonadales bacterium]